MDKEALVIDERFNNGGQIPDRFIELLNRPMLSYWAVRDGESQQWPPVSHAGPKVMLINDADTQARWWMRLKDEWLAAQAERRPFANPLTPMTLRWRS